MSAEWKEETLGDFIERGEATLQTGPFGTALKAAEYTKVGVPLISVKEIRGGYLDVSSETPRVSQATTSRLPRFVLQQGDIVFGRKGGVDRNAIIESSQCGWFLGSDGIRLRLATTVDSVYFSYLMRSSATKSWLLQHCEGTTMPSLNQKVLRRLPVKYPPFRLQRRIGRFLKGIDEKVKANHQINQTLEQMGQAIFKSWFVDFEPVRAKIEILEAGGNEQDALLAAMQAISGKSLEQLEHLKAESPEQYSELEATAELFPSAMQESALGDIPEGWKVLPLSNMVVLIGGGTPKKSKPSYWNGDICWFSVKDVPNDGDVFVIDTEDKITDAGLNGSSTKLLPIGTTIITARGTVGKLALTGVVTAMNQSCYGVVGSDGAGPYLNYLRLNRAVDTLKRNTHGAVFDTITRTTFETAVQPQPCLELRQRFEKVVEPVFEAIKSNLHQSETLCELRDTLLPKLLSGELTLPEAEEQVVKQQDVAHV